VQLYKGELCHWGLDITISLSDRAHTTVSLQELFFSWKLFIFPPAIINKS